MIHGREADGIHIRGKKKGTAPLREIDSRDCPPKLADRTLNAGPSALPICLFVCFVDGLIDRSISAD